ncbi:hypothetical protein GIB67_019176 [Kingdonia uniflora]|uniref:Uncharacterized protein n=1 Tax=Kingdonia uniflora TaxID=39325 RepID=A0A7J7MZY7_9MAGN|nr:hypothetical protein GIB67_019176 [Kingdonia uniflora]
MEKTTSGTRVILVMQLFYRLSSAVGGPFTDRSNPHSLDMEKFIQWFLDEINVNESFVAKTSSSFGETVILVFMYFTLILRNWHQPGSEHKSSGSTADTTQEKNALSSTSDAALSPLLHVFKSSSTVNIEDGGNLGLGCGALLTVRRDLSAGNYSPFFSDSYAKAHRMDIFMDYQRLLKGFSSEKCKVGYLKKKKNEDRGESGPEKSYLDMEQSVAIFNDTVLRQFIDSFLMEWNSNTVRVEAKCVLYGIWHLASGITNITAYTELVTWLLGTTVPDSNSSKQQKMELVSRCLTPDS